MSISENAIHWPFCEMYKQNGGGGRGGGDNYFPDDISLLYTFLPGTF